MTLDADGQPNAAGLVVEGVTKDFVGLRALDSVSLGLERGEILGLIGPNGSGKTTLINILTGFLKATAGRIRIDGVEITNWSPHRIAPLGLARTFQTIKLFLGLTVLENVEVAAVSAHLPRARARRRAYQALERLGVSGLADHPAGGLPYGAERRVEIARALATDPNYMLLDEPAAGLNAADSDEDAGLHPPRHGLRHPDCRSRHAPHYAPVRSGPRVELRQDHRGRPA